MSDKISRVLKKENFSKADIVKLLQTNKEERQLLFAKANEVKKEYVGLKTYYRGLIEFSNICAKDCYYCGIRASNKNVKRYDISDEQILQAVKFAYDNTNSGQIVLLST
jgi:biotin synthase